MENRHRQRIGKYLPMPMPIPTIADAILADADSMKNC